MIIMTGDTMSSVLVAELRRLGWGRMFVTHKPAPYEGELWGFDNGAFGSWLKGKPFPADEFLRRLDKAVKIGRPHLAVAPDIVGGGVASLDFSLGWLDRLPTDWPWYLAVQDGMTSHDVRGCIEGFSGLFLGGTTRFKSTASTWRRLASESGRRFHYARAGTLTRVEHAIAVQADSLDSSFPLWTRERFKAFVSFVENAQQGQLPTIAAWLSGRPVGPDGELAGDPITGAYW